MYKAILFIFLVILSSCDQDKIPLPKPRIYPKVIYPQKNIQKLEISSCPFEFERPAYFKYKADDKRLLEEKEFECWFDLHCEELNSNIHLSYIPISKTSPFDKLVYDAFNLVNKHNIKASSREEIKFSYENKKVHGLIFKIDGPVASPIQFFVTDSTKHFLRGSLYFNDIVNRDSIAPVYTFLEEDIMLLLKSINWTR